MTPHDISPRPTDLKSNCLALIITTFSLIGLLSLQSKTIFEAKSSSSIVSENEIEIMWDIQQVNEPESNTKKFIEANPDTQINPPDKTDNFSFRNQQAAQPSISNLKTKKDLPALQGVEFSSKVTPSSQQSSSLKKMPEVPEMQIPKKDNQEAETKIKPKYSSKNMQVAELESTGKEGLEVEKHEHEGNEKVINLSKKLSEANNLQEEKQIASLQPSKVSKISARPRLRLSPELLRGPVMKTISNAPRIGALAVECRLHPYGVYVQEMLRSIENQWHHLANSSLKFIQRDKLKPKISFRFQLLSDGTIKDLESLDNEEDSLPKEICRQAIASRVPYGKWTEKMVEDFGFSDIITIHFNYR